MGRRRGHRHEECRQRLVRRAPARLDDHRGYPRYYGTNAHHDVTWLSGTAGTSPSRCATTRSATHGPPSRRATARSASRAAGTTPTATCRGSSPAGTPPPWAVSSPRTRSWASHADPDSRHLHAYAAGEPIGAWDPDGRRLLFNAHHLVGKDIDEIGGIGRFSPTPDGWLLTTRTVHIATARVRTTFESKSVLADRAYPSWRVTVSILNLDQGGDITIGFGGGASLSSSISVDVFRLRPGGQWRRIGGREVVADFETDYGIPFYGGPNLEESFYRYGPFADRFSGGCCLRGVDNGIKAGDRVYIQSQFRLQSYSVGLSETRAHLDVSNYRVRLDAP